jgi:hypothetical protein
MKAPDVRFLNQVKMDLFYQAAENLWDILLNMNLLARNW